MTRSTGTQWSTSRQATGPTGASRSAWSAQNRVLQTFVCETCGTQYAESKTPPERCPICDDERQYVGWTGQRWITLNDLRGTHGNIIRQAEENLWGIGTDPKFAIGQRAMLVRAREGNLLWDCVSLLDDATVRAVRDIGGVSAIAVSHPHFYASMVEWSHAFGDVPIYLHAEDRAWVQRPDPCIAYWNDRTLRLTEELTLIHTGGHFAGSQVLHWSGDAEGRGVLLSGDQPQVCADRRYVSFMYSYPNYIPLAPAAVRHILDALEPFEFDRIYGGWFDRVVDHDAKQVVRRSAERYLRAIGPEG